MQRVQFFILLVASLLGSSTFKLNAQITRKVLFLGNSYTGVNNLPQLVHDVALSAGDTLIFDANFPGGYQLQDHVIDATSQNKINAGGWQYVVIQGQSQEPVIFSSQFNNGGGALYNLIKQSNPCAVVMPYMTWGRKNGDASTCPNFPLMCTYQKMDSTIKSRYLNLTKSINGEVSPVSVVWKYLRQNNPSIDLYQLDESHPSMAGSYAAACCFYASIFKKDPTAITYDFGLSATDAAAIRNAAKTQVFDSLSVWDYKKMPTSNFTYQIGSGVNQVNFSPISLGVKQNYSWTFGDGGTSTVSNPSHSYLNNGTYTVTLTTSNCDLQGQHTSIKDTVIQFCSHTPTVFTSKPWLCKYDTLYTQAADSYQWYCFGVPLPETNQYLANYAKYNISGFSVKASLNGCAEMSQTFTKNQEWTGYYFDLIGDPCEGDTVAFAVLHTNGFLSGSEKIFWFKNGQALSSMLDKDTLIITTGGTYQCKMINPNSNCPFDTTSYTIKYNCGVIDGVEDLDRIDYWGIFPNPATEFITVILRGPAAKQRIEILNAAGQLIKVSDVSGTTTLRISELPPGLYFLHLKGNSQSHLKFIKE